jgi:outer membrane protein assembly factor BamB
VSLAWDYPVEGVILGGPAADERTVYFAVQHGELYALDIPTGRERWRVTLPATTASTPVLSGNTLYLTATFRDPNIGVLLAIDARTGEETWSFEGSGTDVTSPALAGELVVFADSGGVLHAVDARTGIERWSYTTEAPLSSTPFESGGLLYLGDYEGNFLALDAATGGLEWTVSAPRDNQWDPAPVLGTAAGGGTAFYARQDRATLYAVDAVTGRERWSFDATPTGTPWPNLSPGARYVVLATSSPGTGRDTVYVGISFGEMGNPAPYRTGFLYALDIRTGAVKWRFEAANEIYSQPIVHNGLVLFASKHGLVHALNAETGVQLWSREADGPMHSAILPAGDTLLFGTWAGTFYALR